MLLQTRLLMLLRLTLSLVMSLSPSPFASSKTAAAAPTPPPPPPPPVIPILLVGVILCLKGRLMATHAGFGPLGGATLWDDAVVDDDVVVVAFKVRCEIKLEDCSALMSSGLIRVKASNEFTSRSKSSSSAGRGGGGVARGYEEEDLTGYKDLEEELLIDWWLINCWLVTCRLIDWWRRAADRKSTRRRDGSEVTPPTLPSPPSPPTPPTAGVDSSKLMILLCGVLTN